MKEKQTKTNSNSLLGFISLVLVLTIIASSAIGLYAWARYTSSQSGNATATVAKWNFNLSLTSGATTVTGNTSLNLATTLDNEATHVADGKIAPGTSGTFDIEIDTRGTEVSMVYDVTIGITNCPRNITFSKKGPGENSFSEISSMQTGDTTQRGRTINFTKNLSLSDVTTANTNDTKFIETIKWEWPYELTGNDPTTQQPYTATQKTNYDGRDNADQGLNTTLTITAVGTETTSAASSGQQPEDTGVGTPVETAITSADYGKYVDIGTTILSTYQQGDTLPTLSNLSNNATASDYTVYADWRVLYKDSNGMYLILADNLPVGSGTVGASVVSGVGLQYSGSTGVYNNGITRQQFLNRLNGDWIDLISDTALASKTGVQVKGAIDLGTWVDSWNATHSSKKFYKSASGDGYNVSAQNSTPGNDEYAAYVNEDTEYNVFMSGLYIPHDSDSYFIGTPSLEDNTYVMMAGMYDTSVGIYGNDYLYPDQGVRPVIFVPNAVKIDKTNSVYTIQ